MMYCLQIDTIIIYFNSTRSVSESAGVEQHQRSVFTILDEISELIKCLKPGTRIVLKWSQIVLESEMNQWALGAMNRWEHYCWSYIIPEQSHLPRQDPLDKW